MFDELRGGARRHHLERSPGTRAQGRAARSSRMFDRLPVTLLALLCACGGSVREGPGGGSAGSKAGAKTELSVSAQTNYEKGMKLLQNEEWPEAAKYFAFIKARYPYSKYAVLADLRIADAEFGLEAYLEAVDQYKLFLKFHPTHEMVENGYVAFKIGECYYNMLPDEWFLAPPAYEKDQSAALDAARELKNVSKNYPRSPFVTKANELHTKVAHLLAAHEWYVAEFYWKRGAPMGTVIRLRALLKNYSGAGYDEEALWLLGRAYEQVGHKDDAKKSFQKLIELYPKSQQADEARHELASLGG
jgi:outer membrane protein assembly factor BamD